MFLKRIYCHQLACMFAMLINLLMLTDSFATVNDNYRYLSDDLVVVFMDDSSKPAIVDVSLNRKQIGNSYLHYNFLSILGEGVDLHVSETMRNASDQVVAFQSLTHFSRKEFPDLSSREKIDLRIDVGGERVRVIVPQIDADFLIRSTPEHFKFAGEAEAIVEFRGKTYKGRALLSRVYSENYFKRIFFPGSESIPSETRALVLWDEDYNLYVLDRSFVMDAHPAYPSHTWVLLKDGRTKETRKSYSAEVQIEKNPDGTASWTVQLSDQEDIAISLKTVHEKSLKKGEGTVVGSVKRSGRSLPAYGMFTHHFYNQGN